MVSVSTCTSLPVCMRVSVPRTAALLKQHVPFRWRGDYGGKKQLWFPANYVEELPSSAVPELDEAVSSEQTNTVSRSCRFQS